MGILHTIFRAFFVENNIEFLYQEYAFFPEYHMAMEVRKLFWVFLSTTCATSMHCRGTERFLTAFLTAVFGEV